MRMIGLIVILTAVLGGSVAKPELTANAFADGGEPWTESTSNWSLQIHQDKTEKPHASNLRFDRAFKRFGEGSLAFDMVRPDLAKFHYTELRLTLPQPFDARAFDNLYLSYHVPAGMKLTRLYVTFTSPNWKSSIELPESLKPVTGEWQDITIPLTQFGSKQPGWNWGNVGNVTIFFFWDAAPEKAGAIHVDGVYFERTGDGIGNRKAPPAILFLDYYFANKDIDHTHRKTIEAKGYTAVWDLLQKQTWATISKFNVVVLGIHPEIDINKPTDWSGEFAGKIDLLRKYVQEGGGLFVTSTPGSTNAGTGINLLLEPMGVTFVNEQVSDPKGITTQQEMFPNMEFAYTDAVKKDPLTDGVPGMWYCTSVQFTGGGGGSFTAALIPGADWNVLIHAGATAGTHRYQGAFGIEEATATYSSSPPLCATRQVGKGRVAVLPMNMTHTWLSGYHPWWQALVMSKGAKDKPSGVERLMLNLYDWLAKPSKESGSVGGHLGAKPEPITGAKLVSAGDEGGKIDWEKLPPPQPSSHNYMGLIGAHSAYSDGQGTVTEWVAAAKAAGYNWIAFTELHPKMNAEKWEQLKAQCKQASDERFCAIPGMELIDQAGNHSLVLAPIPWPDPKLENDRMDLPQSVGYAYGFPAQVQFRMHEGLLPWYRNQFHFAGVFTYRDGKLVDEAEKEYWELQARTFKCWPVAVHETYKPEDIAKERQVGYQTCYTFGPLNKMLDDFCFANYKFFWHHDLAYVSSGPRIERFSIQNNGTSYFDIPPEWSDSWRATEGADRWRATLSVSSPVGLSSVRLTDAGKPLRDFRLAGGKSFAQSVDGHHDRQYCLGVEVTDAQGGRAFASASGTTAGRHRYGNCTGNVNIMEGGTYGTSDKPPLGYECYFPRWGFWLWPDLYLQDRGPLQLPHDERLRFASTDCTIVDHLFTLTHDPKVPNVGGGRVMRPLYPIKDFEARTRAIRFTAGVDTPEFILLEPQIKLRRDVTLTAGPFPNLRFLFLSHGKPMAKGDFNFETLTTDDGRTLVESTPTKNTWPSVSKRGTLPVGGYAGAFPNYTGAGAVFALEPDTQFAIEGNADGRRIQIGKDLKPGTVLKAGTVLSTRVLYMEGKWRQPAGNSEIENARKFLGLNGPPGYTVTPTVGRVADTRFICTLATDKGAFRAKFSQTPLPVDLPVLVPDLNPRWDAGIWIVGTDRVRHFGIFEGAGYTTLRLDKGPVEAFIGHPIVCDSPDLWLSLIEADAKRLIVEVHNPTDKPIKTRVRKNAGFELGPGLEKTVTVEAGQSLRVEVP
ncbi:MAG: hypothetical protein CO095_06170 [Armatimonadetes bacterium CG_4_9_14_3_um_filter_58_7]|nr:MAG: hypothetical protein CO095_06170 [Armatimonadetes bacterium CG_4_9_14_3_um_filter_58_7]